MDNIPSTYWMIVIGFISASIFALISYLAVSARELSITLRTTNKALSSIEEITSKVKSVVNDMEVEVKQFVSTFHIFNTVIRRPIDYVEKIVTKIFVKEEK